MYMLQVTLTSAATPIVPYGGAPYQASAPFQTVVFCPGAHTYNVGDSKVSASLGATVPTTGPSLVIPTVSLTQNLNGWYLFGTSGDVITILVLE